MTTPTTDAKPCTACGQVKPFSAFEKKPTGRLRSRCRQCRNADRVRYYWQDVETTRAVDRIKYAERRRVSRTQPESPLPDSGR